MALIFTLVIAFVLLHRVPILGHLIVVVLVVTTIVFAVAVVKEYNDIVYKREHTTEIRR